MLRLEKIMLKLRTFYLGRNIGLFYGLKTYLEESGLVDKFVYLENFSEIDEILSSGKNRALVLIEEDKNNKNANLNKLIKSELVNILVSAEKLSFERARFWLSQGAKGYIKQENPQKVWRKAIQIVAQDGIYIEPALTNQFEQLFKFIIEKENQISMFAQQVNSLNFEEKKILTLLAEGLSDKEIAQQIFWSIPTTRLRRKKIFQKLNIHQPIEARLWLERMSLINSLFGKM